jgi:hypothetical protein
MDSKQEMTGWPDLGAAESERTVRPVKDANSFTAEDVTHSWRSNIDLATNRATLT